MPAVLEPAVHLLRLAHSRQPDRVEISGALAQGLEEAGQPGAAAQVHLETAVLLARQGDYAASEEHFRRSLGGTPGSSAAIAGLAQVLLAQGKTDQAAETVKLGADQGVVTPETIAVRAEILAKTGDIPAAIEATRGGLDMFGNNPALVRTYVRLLIDAGQAEDAAPWLDRALAEDPDDTALLQAKAELLLQASDPAGAIAILRPLVEEFPESPKHRVTLVHALVAAGDEPGAFQVLQAGLSLQPDEPALLGERVTLEQSLVGYAERHFIELDNPSVRAALEGAVALNPENWQAHAELGEVLRREGELEKALEHLDLAVRGKPDDGWAVGTRGQVLYALGRPEALDELRHGVELDDSLSWLHAQLGDAYRMARRYREALGELARATELDPDDAWCWALTGATQSLMGDWETARSSLDRAIQLNPGYAWALAVKASLLASIDELDDALATIATAVNADPQIAWAWGLKAQLLDETGADPAEQEQAARTALSVEPGDIFLYICLAEALLRRHQDEESERNFQNGIDAALASPEMDTDTLQNLAWCYLRLGRFDEALDRLSALLAQNFAISAGYDLGLVLLCAGRTDVAIDEYEDVAARNRSEPHAGRRRSLVRVARGDLKRLIESEQIKPGPEVQRVQQILAQVLAVDPAPEAPR